MKCKILRIKNRDILEYFAVLIAILGMGSLYFQVLRMPLMAVMLISVVILFWCRRPFLRLNNLCIYLAITGFFLLSSAINYKNGFRINDLIIWMVNFIFIITLQSNMTFQSFRNKYVILMVMEAAVSIFFFIWADVLEYPILFLQHEFRDDNSFYLTPFYTLGWGNIPVFYRNAGIFIEPGAHQIFLNFALMFLLSDDKRAGLKRKQYHLSAVLLIIAVLTTMSTTGYMCLAVVFIGVLFKKRSVKKNSVLKICIIAAIFLLFIIESMTGVVQDKILGISTGQGSGGTRLNDTIYGFYIASRNPVFGHGSFMANSAYYYERYGITHISNGLAAFSVSNGFIMAAAVMLMVYRGMKKYFPYGIFFNICIFMLYLLSINSEGFFLNILFLIFIGNWRIKKLD